MKLRLSSMALLLAFVMGTAFAHGNKVHVRGTVEKISADSVVVKTADGKSVEVKFAASTVFLARSNHEDKPAKASELAAGDLVVVHATVNARNDHRPTLLQRKDAPLHHVSRAQSMGRLRRQQNISRANCYLDAAPGYRVAERNLDLARTV